MTTYLLTYQVAEFTVIISYTTYSFTMSKTA